MPEGVQRYQRTKMVLPLRVWSDEQEPDVAPLQLAYTLDISPIGGRLGGLRTQVEPGQTLTLQRGQQKTHVRVIWSKQLAPTEIQAGFETLELGKRIWDVDLPQQAQALHDARQQQLAEAHAAQEKLEEEAWARQTSAHESSDEEIPVEQARAREGEVQESPEISFEQQAGEPADPEQYPGHYDVQRVEPIYVEPDPVVIRRAAVRHMPIAPPAIQMRWIGIAAGLILLSSVGVFMQYKLFGTSSVATIEAPSAKPPTAEELAAMTPKPRKILPRVAAATPDNDSSRLKVAEAPQGHVAYPVAPEAGTKGKVDLKVVIATDGRVKQIQLRSGKQLLAQAAEQAIKLWRYSKHAIDGEPVEAETTVTVSFLGDDAVSLHFPQSTDIRRN